MPGGLDFKFLDKTLWSDQEIRSAWRCERPGERMRDNNTLSPHAPLNLSESSRSTEEVAAKYFFSSLRDILKSSTQSNIMSQRTLFFY